MTFLRLLLVVVAVVGSYAVEFTGDAFADFTNTAIDPSTNRPHNFGVVQQPDAVAGAEFACGGQVCADVGVPEGFCEGDVCPLSGWDIRNVFFQYNDIDDSLLIGVDCFGICGDADGDGFEGSASGALLALGGSDYPDIGRVEGVALVLDFDLNVADVLPSFVPDILTPFDIVIGVPAGQPSGAKVDANPNNPLDVPRLPCTIGVANESLELFSMTRCFGVYDYQDTTAVNLAQRFLRPTTTPEGDIWPVTNGNPLPDIDRPDLEWKIDRISDLKTKLKTPFRRSNREAWTVLMQGFSGSFQDDGVGEDFVPSQTDFVEITFPCLQLDVCDVCLGDGTSCLDCLGVPNGPNVYDECDVCAGDSSSCIDCLGAPNGGAVYDECDVCNGDSSSCVDCLGSPNGAAVYDECDVCNGDGSTCDDCLGVPNGGATYDLCGVCAGDSSSCEDCAGVPNGSSEYDECGVCGGNSDTCLDCLGDPNGSAQYDVCGVCEGDGTTCADCLGEPNGPAEYDACDVCDGDSTTCLDCTGTPNGAAVYDVCDICDGDGTTCLDCLDVPFGTSRYDNCGVCDGDGSSCVCLKIHNCPTAEVDHALLDFTIVATHERLLHTVEVLQGIKDELCRYDVHRGNLAEDISVYLETANAFREVISQFCYVQVWFKDTISDALQMLP